MDLAFAKEYSTIHKGLLHYLGSTRNKQETGMPVSCYFFL